MAWAKAGVPLLEAEPPGVMLGTTGREERWRRRHCCAGGRRDRWSAAGVRPPGRPIPAAAVPLLTRLERRRRTGGTLQAYRAALAEPEGRRTVRRLAAAPDPQVRRFGIALALELGEYVRGDLARTALHDRDHVCRTLCA